MPSLVKRLVCLLTAIALVVPAMASANSNEEEERSSEQGRFAFGLAITSSVLIQPQKGLIVTNENVAPPPAGEVPRSPLGYETLGGINSLTPSVGVNIDVMTPALSFVPTKPRFFAAFEVLPAFSSETTVALNAAATEFSYPQNSEEFPSVWPASSVGGQGSRLRAQVQTLALAANAGISFDLEARGRLLRLKPMVGWIRWGVDANGRLLKVFKDDPVIPAGNVLDPFGANLRLLTITGQNSAEFDAVGPGLELEMELNKVGKFRPVLYMSGYGYRTLSDPKIVFTSTTVVRDALNPAPAQLDRYYVAWLFEVAPWSYRASLGFRLRWVGD